MERACGRARAPAAALSPYCKRVHPRAPQQDRLSRTRALREGRRHREPSPALPMRSRSREPANSLGRWRSRRDLPYATSCGEIGHEDPDSFGGEDRRPPSGDRDLGRSRSREIASRLIRWRGPAPHPPTLRVALHLERRYGRHALRHDRRAQCAHHGAHRPGRRQPSPRRCDSGRGSP